MKGIIKFLKEARGELKKVTWPTWDDVTSSTIVVFITVIMFTVFIYMLDEAVTYILSKVIG